MEWVKKNKGGEDEPVAERECIREFGCKAFDVRTTSKGMALVKRSRGAKTSQRRRDKAFASSVAVCLTKPGGVRKPAVAKQGIGEVVESRSASERRQTGMGCVEKSGGDGKVVDKIFARSFDSCSTS